MERGNTGKDSITTPPTQNSITTDPVPRRLLHPFR
jgi:hypothetical protein